MAVIIGVDPHKATHTAVAIGDDEEELDRMKVRATVKQVEQLSQVGRAVRRVHLGDRVRGRARLSAGPAARRRGRARRRCAGHVGVAGPGARHGAVEQERPERRALGRVAALRSPGLRRVQRADHGEVLRLLAKRNIDIGSQRSRARLPAARRCWRSSPRAESAKEIYASDVDAAPRAPTSRRVRSSRSATTWPSSCSTTFAASTRNSRCPTDGSATPSVHRERRSPTSSASARSSPRCSSATPATSRRFANRDQFAAYNGTAPVEFSSAGRVVHRLSRRGNRQLNHAIHMVAICQLRQPHSEGRAYFDRRSPKARPSKKRCARSNAT